MKLFVSNDREIDVILKRVRAVVARHPGHNIQAVAEAVRVPSPDLERLMEQRERSINRAFLLDVVAALVCEIGIDPHWLLTGECNPTKHREALLLGEDQTPEGRQILREWIHRQYRQLHPHWFNWPVRPPVRASGASRS